jgi:hypothetical protein
VVRDLEASFPRTQRLLVQHDQAVPSRTKITTSAICVCIKFGSERCASAREIRRREIQADPSVFCFRSSLRLETLLF